MASVIKRDNSKFWIACFTDRDGRQLKRSTKSTDRRQAQEIAVELERVEHQARRGVLTTTQIRKVLNDVSEKVTGDSVEAPSVELYLGEWLTGVAARNAEGTVERYQHVARLFLTHLGPRAGKPITTITANDVEQFLNFRLSGNAAPKTAVLDLKILGTAFRRAENYGIILKNPVPAVRLPKAESSEREVFTSEEVQKLLKAAPTLEWQTLILLGYFVGARLGDCVQMQWENIRPKDGVIVYKQQKTGKQVVVPMHYHLIEHLDYLSTFGTKGPLCPSLVNKGSGGKHGLSEVFKRIVQKAGIDPMVVPGKGQRQFTKLTFHSLRHSFTSELANAGVAEEIRMKLTGHTTRPNHSRYTHLQLGTLRTAMAAMPLFKSPAKQLKP